MVSASTSLAEMFRVHNASATPTAIPQAEVQLPVEAAAPVVQRLYAPRSWEPLPQPLVAPAAAAQDQHEDVDKQTVQLRAKLWGLRQQLQDSHDERRFLAEELMMLESKP